MEALTNVAQMVNTFSDFHAIRKYITDLHDPVPWSYPNRNVKLSKSGQFEGQLVKWLYMDCFCRVSSDE
jgi:hypothetical protein